MANYYMTRIKKDKSTGQDDNSFSTNLVSKLNSDLTENDIENDLSAATLSNNINLFDSLYHSNNLRRTRKEIYTTSDDGGPLFTQTFRFGVQNPYGAINNAREFLFFTKPDLHLYSMNYDSSEISAGMINSMARRDVNEGLKREPNPGLTSLFWDDIFKNKNRIVNLLQYGVDASLDPFNHLLQNTVNSNLEVPTLNAPSIETSTNTYGVGLTYRGSSEESDDGPEFSLEFKDDKYLNVYTFFRAYEEYETLKKHGTVKPQRYYVKNKILHDQFAIYKFIVDEDMETIIYWGKYYGVYPTSLPRDAFSSVNFQDGLTFNINFKAAFYEDMRPEILEDFNAISKVVYDRCKYRIDIYNDVLHRMDGRSAKAALVTRVTGGKRAEINPNGYYFKLNWKGDDSF